MNRFNKRIMNRFIGRKTNTIRNKFPGGANVGKSALFIQKVVTDLYICRSLFCRRNHCHDC